MLAYCILRLKRYGFLPILLLLVSTAYAVPPATPVLTAVSSDSITASWGAAAGADGYQLMASTASDFSGVLITSTSLSTALIPLTVSALSPNTTYYLQAGAIFGGTTEYALTQPTSTSTLTEVLPNLSVFDIGMTSVTVTWSTLGAGNALGYRLEASTASNFSGTRFSSSTLDANAAILTLGALAPKTTYYLRATAINWNQAINWTMFGPVVLNPPSVPEGLGGSAQTSSSIQWAWGSISVNTPDDTLTYSLYYATNPTVAVRTGISGPFTTETGLSPNTAYGRHIASVLNGVQSDLSESATTYTFASTPGQPSFSSVGSSSMTVSWSTGGNPGSTEYEVSFSSSALFDVNVSTVVFGSFTGNTTSFAQLQPSTTYYVRVQARNGDGISTSYSAVGSTVTLQPDRPTNLVGVALDTSQIQWTWTGVPGATEYRLYQASSPATLVASLPSIPTLYVEPGLSTNTATGRVISAVVSGIESSLSSSATTYTLAAVPSGSVVTGVDTTSATVHWNASGNPSGTIYQVQLSTQIGFGTFGSDPAIGTQDTLIALQSNATYYFRVNAQNGDGFYTGFDSTVSSVTLPATPTGGAISNVTDVAFSVDWNASTNAPGTQYQAELSTVSLVGPSTVTFLTSGTSAAFTSLATQTVYYARVKVIGITGIESPYLLIGSTLTALPVPTQLQFSNVGISSITFGWQSLSGPGFEDVAELRVSTNPLTLQITSSTISSAVFTNLSANVSYNATVRTRNTSTGNFSSYATPIASYTLANVPTQLSTTTLSISSVTLAWQGNGNPSGTQYALERSVDGLNFFLLTLQTTLTFLDSTVSQGTSYTYRVRAFNGNIIPTDYSTLVVQTPGQVGVPKTVSGIRATRTDLGGGSIQMAFTWHDVDLRTNGLPLSNRYGYVIYTSTDALLSKDLWVSVTTATTASYSPTISSTPVRYYVWRTIDTGGIQSDWSQIVDSSVDMNHIFIGSDNLSYASIPDASAQQMLTENHSYGGDIVVEVSHTPAEETGRVLRSVPMRFVNSLTGAEVTTFSLSGAALRGVIHYSVQSGNVVAGAPSMVLPAPVISAADAASQLSLFWFNGNEWIKRSATIDPTTQTVQFSVSHAGRFQVRAATHGGLTLVKVYPRIFTPNGDQWNDKVVFSFDNPRSESLGGKIFDLSGSRVADMAPGPDPVSMLVWDGKDSGGRTVPGGVYLYQLDFGGQKRTGTVVVAR